MTSPNSSIICKFINIFDCGGAGGYAVYAAGLPKKNTQGGKALSVVFLSHAASRHRLFGGPLAALL